jgi:broad specificity phosphatase PhoE
MDAGAFGVLRRDPWLSRDRKVYEDPRLREQEWGNFRTVEETERIQKERYAYGPFYYRFPHGESCADVYDRVSSFLETMHRDFDDQDYPENALIVSHGMTIRLFIMRWFHISVKEFESWANPSNCQRLIMEMGKDGRYVMPKMELGEMGG